MSKITASCSACRSAWCTGDPLILFSELHMVQDSSVDFQDTWDFLGRRMEDSAALGQARKQVSTQWTQFHG